MTVHLHESSKQHEWLSALQSLNHQGCLVVKHEPDDTRRYERARTQLVFVLKQAFVMGTRPSAGHEEYAVDLAMWCQSPAGWGCGF